MRKILNAIVLFCFVFHQMAWAAPLLWNPNFQSASVTIYHDDEQGRRWVMLAKQNYSDKLYDAPAWADFGGKIEDKDLKDCDTSIFAAATAAARELDEEAGIHTTPEELMGCAYHQTDMAKSPFGNSGVSRHTIFFKSVHEMFLPAVEADITSGPRSDGSGEVSKYQWVLASDLLKMEIPGIFGQVLGLYTPDALRVESLNAEHFSVPFFVVLQQPAVKSILLKQAHKQTFSQIVFTTQGFRGWRLVHSGKLALSYDAEQEYQTRQVLDFDPEAKQNSEIEHNDTASGVGVGAGSGSSASPTTAPTTSSPQVQIRLFHKPSDEANMYPFEPKSTNFWNVESSDKSIQQLMVQYTKRTRVLKELKIKFQESFAETTPPRLSSLPTMTDAQLQYLLGESVDLHDTAATLEAYKAKVKQLQPTAPVDTITHPNFVAAVEKVLTTEREHQGMFTAYHGCTAEIHFLNTVYSVLSEILGLPKLPIQWRFPDKAAKHYDSVSDAFVDAAQSTIQDSGFVNTFDLLLSANAALTGNPGHSGCRTLTYWKNSHSEVSLDFRQKLNNVFAGVGLSSDQAETLAKQFYNLYEHLYVVDDPEAETFASAASAASSDDTTVTKRRVGVLRQLFVTPESVERELAISGWFFDHPLSFSDKHLPNGSVVGIYDGLENDDSAWMKSLPDSLRFMAHIRAGHSEIMERNIAIYHDTAPDGLRPVNVHDFEVRFRSVQETGVEVQTHFYPSSDADSTRERDAIAGALSLIDNTLDGAELPIRSFHAFHIAHKNLQQIIKNQLSVNVAPASVSLDQFKSAIAQGDREAMEVYLSNPSTHDQSITAVDVISGETRSFTLADYVVMVSMVNNMAAPTIVAVGDKYKLLSPEKLHLTETPYALYALLLKEGFHGFEKFGWRGELNLPFRVAAPKCLGASVAGAGVAKEKRFEGIFETVTVEKPLNKDYYSPVMQNVVFETDYSKLPTAFWVNLANQNRIDDFLRHGFFDNVTMDRWMAVVTGFDAEFDTVPKTEKYLFENHCDSLLEIFKNKKKDPSGSAQITDISKRAATHILQNLVAIHGRDVIFSKLKAFEADFGFNLVTENSNHSESIQHQSWHIYEIFRDAGLIDNTWVRFSQPLFLNNYGKEIQNISDILKIIQEGQYTAFCPYLFCSSLQRVPFVNFQEYLRNPLLSNLILEGFRYTDHIEESAKLSPAEKRTLHQQLYNLAYQKGKIATIKTIPAEAAEWFAALDEGERVAMLKSPDFNAKIADLVGLPSTYTDEDSISTLRAELLPTEELAIDFMLKSVDMPSKMSMGWFINLLQPYIPAAFAAVLGNPSSVSPFAAVLFATSGLQVPEDYHPDLLATLTEKLYSESVLLLSPAQVIHTLKNHQRWIFAHSSCGMNVDDLLTARLELIKDEVKAALADDSDDSKTKDALHTMAVKAKYMNQNMKAFFGFISAD